MRVPPPHSHTHSRPYSDYITPWVLLYIPLTSVVLFMGRWRLVRFCTVRLQNVLLMKLKLATHSKLIRPIDKGDNGENSINKFNALKVYIYFICL